MATAGDLVVVGWGANSSSQLALGDHLENVCSPTRIGKADGLKAKLVASGNCHSMVGTADQRLFACGSNSFGQLAVETVPLRRLFDEFVFVGDFGADLGCIDSIQLGWDVSFVICDKRRRCLSCGHNGFGQLGLGTADRSVRKLTTIDLPLETDETIDKLSVGLRHTLLLTSNGRLFSCGSNKKGQCMVGSDRKTFSEFEAVDIGHRFDCQAVLDIAAGSFYSVVLTANGQVFIEGNSKYFASGRVDVDLGKDQGLLCAVFSGWNHVILQTEANSFYGFGRTDLGQLSSRKRCIWPAEPLQSLNKLTENGRHCQVFCASEYNFALISQTTEDGRLTSELYSWGWNEHGVLGIGSEKDSFELCPLSDRLRSAVSLQLSAPFLVSSLSVSCGHTLLLVSPSRCQAQ